MGDVVKFKTTSPFLKPLSNIFASLSFLEDMGTDHTKHKLLFVINPVSGGLNKRSCEFQIKRFCDEENINYKIYYTTGESDIEQLKTIHEEFNSNAIIAAGGDGTVHLVGKVVSNTNIPLGILPLGSANGLAKELGIPLDLPKALKNLIHFNIKSIDTLMVNNHQAFHLSDFGFNAHIVRKFSELKKRGFLSYAWLAFRDFFRYKFSEFEIQAGDAFYKGKAFMVIITNARKFGADLTINPKGKIDDGYFEISIVKDFPKASFFKIAYRLMTDRIHHSKYAMIIKTKKATIYNRAKRSFHIDGEPFKPFTKVDVLINPASLNIIVPEERNKIN